MEIVSLNWLLEASVCSPLGPGTHGGIERPLVDDTTAILREVTLQQKPEYRIASCHNTHLCNTHTHIPSGLRRKISTVDLN